MKVSQRFISRLAENLEWAKQRAKEERGVAMPLVAIVLTVLVALTAVGVDTGRVATVATEAQTAADIAATAGTLALLDEEDPEDGAIDVLAHNKVNGTVASSKLTELVAGYIDSDYNFTAGGTPENAVRAQVTATIDNVVLGAIGAPQSTLVREAIATFSGLGSGIPTLPIVIGECHFDADCTEQPCMPSLGQVPSPTDNSGWTGFFDSASQNDVLDYMPSASGCDGGGLTQNIKVGDIINIGNGQTKPLLDAVECAVNRGFTTFTIPIIECGHNYNQPREVLGFAKVEVDYVITTGSPKGIWLHGVYEGKQPGPPGGGKFGLLAVSLVK